MASFIPFLLLSPSVRSHLPPPALTKSQRTPPSFPNFIEGLRERENGSSTGVFYLSDFGGDPTGRNDSTGALYAAISAAFRHVVPGHFINNMSSIGGATVDLEGGKDYI